MSSDPQEESLRIYQGTTTTVASTRISTEASDERHWFSPSNSTLLSLQPQITEALATLERLQPDADASPHAEVQRHQERCKTLLTLFQTRVGRITELSQACLRTMEKTKRRGENEMNRSSDADQDVRLAEAKRNFIIELLECKKVLEEAICVMEEVDRDVREVYSSGAAAQDTIQTRVWVDRKVQQFGEPLKTSMTVVSSSMAITAQWIPTSFAVVAKTFSTISTLMNATSSMVLDVCLKDRANREKRILGQDSSLAHLSELNKMVKSIERCNDEMQAIYGKYKNDVSKTLNSKVLGQGMLNGEGVATLMDDVEETRYGLEEHNRQIYFDPAGRYV